MKDKITITKIALKLFEILDPLKKEDNIVFFSDFTREINRVILNEDNVDFIFEKIGTRYRNFLIDEFQDTSKLQFHNLLPLIHNAMAENNANFIVGDPKQSVYRWRNADVNQFIELFTNKNISLDKLKQDWEKFKPLISNISLSSNYRSGKEIVEFNNRIFKDLKYSDEKYSYPLIEKVYKNAEQTVQLKNSAYVEVVEYNCGNSLFNNSEKRLKQFADDLIEKINECIENGFQQKDICVLLRKNNDIQKIIQSAGHRKLNNGEVLNFISPESISIYQSEELSFLVSFMELLVDNKNSIASAVCWNHISKTNYKETKNFYAEYIQKEDFKSLFSVNNLVKYDLCQICLLAIHYFNIEMNAYVQKFIDIVNKFTHQYAMRGNTIENFLQFWKKNKNSFTLTLNKDINATKIMTIHKSKGLEFPVVMTYLNFYNRGDSYWHFIHDNFEIKIPPCDIASDTSDIIKDFQNFYLYLNTEEIGKTSPEKALSLLELEHLENINLIYVALTRAMNRMYVFADHNNSRDASKYYDKILRPKLKAEDKNENETAQTTICSMGNKKIKYSESKKNEEAKNIDISNEKLKYNHHLFLANNANPYSDENIDLGIKIHRILEHLNSNNIESAVQKALAKGIISEEEKERFIQTIQPLVEHHELKEYFNLNNIKDILNESDIFVEDKTYRPDKIIHTKNNQVIVLEFKTGKELERYQRQIKHYLQIIREIYPKKSVKGFLIYLKQDALAVQSIQ